VKAGPLGRLLDRRPLGPGDVRAVFDTLVDPATDEVVRGALLVAQASRPESTRELVLFAREMRRRARPFVVPAEDRAVDLCGSGGAPVPSFNVSTVGAIVAAAAGARVVKHGNRSARGPCGSSDLLEALGLPVTRSVEFARRTYSRFGLAFLHAPLFHPATRAVVDVRARLGIATLFNRLGLLSNPARVRFQVVGVASPRATAGVAEALEALGVRSGIAMSSEEGCDEFSPRRRTTATRWSGGHRVRAQFDPTRWLTREERAGSWGALPPAAAARETIRLLNGAQDARRGAVLLTSGAALWVSGRARSMADGVARSRTALEDGRAIRLLGDLRAVARRLGGG